MEKNEITAKKEIRYNDIVFMVNPSLIFYT